MARSKQRWRAQAADSSSGSDPKTSFKEHLAQSMERSEREGDWESWLHCALETGDPQFWPRIREFYRDEPKFRHMVLFHLRFYWTEHESRVAPLIREALRDPEQCDEALQLADVFPSLREHVIPALKDGECLSKVFDSLPLVIACAREQPDLAAPLLQEALRDPRCSHKAVWAAAALPRLADDVVTYLRSPASRETLTADDMVSCLACLFGLVELPDLFAQFAWGGVDPVLDGVRAELNRRYSLDLDLMVSPAGLPASSDEDSSGLE
jgi:hypothetical protein